MEKFENINERIERLKREYDERHIKEEFTKYNETLKSNYIFMIRQAHKCLQQIIQYSMYSKKDGRIYNDFSYIVAYYHKVILDNLKLTSKSFKGYDESDMLPGYDHNMLLGIILFPTDKMYMEKFERGDMSLDLTDIPNEIINGKESQIKLENKLFDELLNNDMLNSKNANIDSDTENVIDSFQFNLIKLFLTGKIYDEKFNFTNIKNALFNYRNYVDKSIANQFGVLLSHYHYSNEMLEYNFYRENIKEKYDLILSPILTTRNKTRGNVLDKELGYNKK